MVLTADLFPERAATETMLSLSEVRDAAEKAQIAAALDRTGGQVGEAAKLLRVSRTTLWEKMQKLGL
jgi:transcriptional regulator of acetoin/glycerol metabolism